MRITNLKAAADVVREQAAALLVAGFAEHWPAAWPDLASARRTVAESLDAGRICRAARDDGGDLVGWTAAEPIYGGNVWELNVIVVQPARQRQGIGRALLLDMEEQARERGGLTIWLGSDDEDGMTSLAGLTCIPTRWRIWRRFGTTRGIRMSFTGSWGLPSRGCCRMPTDWGSRTFFWRNRWRGGKLGRFVVKVGVCQ